MTAGQLRRQRAMVVGALTALLWFTISLLTGSWTAAAVAGITLYLGMTVFYSQLDAKNRD